MRFRALVLSAAALGAALMAMSPAAPAGARGVSGGAGTAAYDVSYPQCGGALPGGGSTGIVGVTAGRPFSANYCLGSEYKWAQGKAQPPQLYMNTSNPETASAYWNTRAGSGPRVCTSANLSDPGNLDCAYNYGWNAARDAVSQAVASIGKNAVTHAWWLDVETANSWNGTAAANGQDLQGSIDYLRSVAVPGTGFYSTGYQWGVITGGYHPSAVTPSPANWLAGASNASQARSWCAPTRSFSGGAVRLVQYPSGSFDGDYVC